jgi:hypothetical protein
MINVTLIDITLQNLVILLLIVFIIGLIVGVSLGRPRMM